MKNSWANLAIWVTALVIGASSAAPQTHLALSREVNLPVATERGSWGNIWGRNLPARDKFAWSHAPDDSFLVFDSDTTGNWPLIRVRNWWSEKPEMDVMNLPGWNTAAFQKFMSHWFVDIKIDLQVTPDGRYAIAFGEAELEENALIDLFRMHDRKTVTPDPDTIITVVDLEHWQVVKTIHTSSLGNMKVERARVLNGGWIALAHRNSVDLPEGGGNAYAIPGVRLLSIPALNPGPVCLWGSKSEEARAGTNSQSSCADAYRATGSSSYASLEALIAWGGDAEPLAAGVRGDDFKERTKIKEEDSWERANRGKILENLAIGEWGEYPYDRWFAEGPACESSSHLWYGLHESEEHPFYALEVYDSNGLKKSSNTLRRQLCGDPELDSAKSACGCRVVSVAEADQALLVYCRRARHYDIDLLQRQWLSVFRPSDATGAGIVDLDKGSRLLQSLASADGRVFVVTLEHGEKIRIYAIQDSHIPSAFSPASE